MGIVPADRDGSSRHYFAIRMSRSGSRPALRHRNRRLAVPRAVAPPSRSRGKRYIPHIVPSTIDIGRATAPRPCFAKKRRHRKNNRQGETMPPLPDIYFVSHGELRVAEIMPPRSLPAGHLTAPGKPGL
jgi:hypothetical protein